MSHPSSELEALLHDISGPQARVDHLNQTAWDDRLDDPARSRRLSEWAHELSTTGEYAIDPYRLGLAGSLRTLAFLNNDVGNYTEALTNSLRALEMLEAIGGGGAEALPVMIDILGTMSWTYRGYSDYGAAAEYGMKALKLAEELGDRQRQARLLNILGNIYADSNDLDAAVEMSERALRLYSELGQASGESVVLNNLALTYLQRGDGDRALWACSESLRIAHEKNIAAVALTALSTLGEIHLGLKEYAQAEHDLRHALALARERGARYDEYLNLQNLGKVHFNQGDAAAALGVFREALSVAEALNDRVGQSQCHQLMSEAHEILGAVTAALEHFKRFHALKETVFNENASKRLAGLQVTHQVETAKRDSEIQYLRTIELKKEIEERKAAQAALEVLANIDSLTGLLNRREFFSLGELEVQRAQLTDQPITAILFDVDHFKRINDTFGHAVGDQALAHVAQVVRQNLREGELIGRYGGDEFVILLPGSNRAQGWQVAERLRTGLAGQSIATQRGVLALTLSLGIAEANAAQAVGLEGLLDLADQALYAAKQAGRNRVAVLPV